VRSTGATHVDDADVRRPGAHRRKEDEISCRRLGSMDFDADAELFSRGPRQIELVLLKNVANKPAAVEAGLRCCSAQAIWRAFQTGRSVDQCFHRQKRVGLR
jgi:hypothetical protein